LYVLAQVAPVVYHSGSMAGSVLKSGKFWIGILISGVFLYVAFRGIDFGALVKVIGGLNPIWIFVGFGFYILNLVVRAVRWQYIYRHVKPVSFWGIMGATIVGYFANNVLPMRLGEVARAVYIGEKEGADKSASLGTIAVERIFDVILALALLALTFILFPFPKELIGEWTVYFKSAGQAFGLISAVGLVAMIVMVKRRDWTLRTLDRVLGPLPERIRSSAGKLAHSFIDGLAILTSPFEVLVLLFMSVMVYLTNLWPIWCVGLAFGVPGMNFTFTEQLFLLAAGAVAAAIPASPGFVGTFHYATKKAVAIILVVKFAQGGIAATGIEPGMFGEWGLSYAVLVHALYIITTTTTGAIILAYSGVSFSRLHGEAAELKTEEVK